jgi:hypothetical protein
MKHNKLVISVLSLVALIVLLSTTKSVSAQERPMFSKEDVEASRRANQAPNLVLSCSGPITRVIDVGYEGLRTTPAVFGSNPGGGEGGQFDKTPVLSTRVTLTKGTCLNAHLSAIVGSKLYGASPLALFQVTLTRVMAGATPQHMVGHYETPYGKASPAIGMEAESDVDMLGSNFFQKVGTGPHEVPPGIYRVDVWWAGAPPGSSGGAVGFAFVLKLYLR